jgi:hypothetical protein
MSDPRINPPPPPRRNVGAGVAFLVIGLLILVPSGLCTGVLVGGTLIESFIHPSGSSDLDSVFFMGLIFGGPFIIGGAVLVWQGVERLRRRD